MAATSVGPPANILGQEVNTDEQPGIVEADAEPRVVSPALPVLGKFIQVQHVLCLAGLTIYVLIDGVSTLVAA